MFVAQIPNRNSNPAFLLRETYREGGKVKSRTLANLTHWSPERIQRLREALQPCSSREQSLAESFEILRSIPHGHVAAALGTLRKLGLAQIVDRRKGPYLPLCLAMIVARILHPSSKLATSRFLNEQTRADSLSEELGLEAVDEQQLYAAMDYLLSQQARIEKNLAKRHLANGSLVLYDVSSTYFEGRHCPLAKLGHSRDGKKDRPQIVFGLMTNAEGCPVAVEVFEGNTADPNTVRVQIEKLIERFGLTRIVLVGDRGMITEARIREEIRKVAGLDWISALRAPAIAKLVEQGALQLSLFDTKDLVEIRSDQFPGERLVVCKNPLLATERTRKRDELLAATEKGFEKIRQATLRSRAPLRGKAAIGMRVAQVAGRHKMRKHFVLDIGEDHFRYARKEASIAAEAALDGFYVIRTSLAAEVMASEQVVRSYKGLSAVEHAFRSLKTVDLKVRPIFHRLEGRVRAHVFLCMLAYYVEWHMRRALAPMLFDDDDRESKESLRSSVIAPAQRSRRAQKKAASKTTDAGQPVHSFQSLLLDLATLAKIRVQPSADAASAFDTYTRPTPIQQRAFDLLGVDHRPNSM